MKKMGNIIVVMLDVLFALGLIIKIVMGDGELEDIIGLCIVVLVGISIVREHLKRTSTKN